MDFVFPDLLNENAVGTAALIAPHVRTVEMLNRKITDRLPGEWHTVYGTNTIGDGDQVLGNDFVEGFEMKNVPNTELRYVGF